MRRLAAAQFLFTLALSVPAPADAQWVKLDSVRVSAVAGHSARPGDEVRIMVILDHPKGFHSWPHQAMAPRELGTISLFSTGVEVRVPEGVKVGEIQWPAPTSVTVRYARDPLKLMAYSGQVAIAVPVRIAPSRPPGILKVGIAVTYQPCDEQQCYAPRREELEVPIRVLRLK
jgi:DsbC/DsbD-like thiol-disulfide interchange protein